MIVTRINLDQSVVFEVVEQSPEPLAAVLAVALHRVINNWWSSGFAQSMTKIATWNCNMTFRTKKYQILQHDPDILIIQECENPELNGEWSEFSDWLWVGDNEHKGLGVFSRNNVSLESATIDEPDSRYTISATTDDAINILGVWAMNDKQQPEQRYIGQVYTALQEYSGFVGSDTVVAGDFNWNRIWDDSPNGRLCGDFSDTLGILNNSGLRSAYHTVSGSGFGKEDASTFFMHKKPERGYHTDYIFAPNETVDSPIAFSIGTYDDWIDASDHMPVMIEV